MDRRWRVWESFPSRLLKTKLFRVTHPEEGGWGGLGQTSLRPKKKTKAATWAALFSRFLRRRFYVAASASAFLSSSTSSDTTGRRLFATSTQRRGTLCVQSS